jgi:hypothetical protein
MSHKKSRRILNLKQHGCNDNNCLQNLPALNSGRTLSATSNTSEFCRARDMHCVLNQLMMCRARFARVMQLSTQPPTTLMGTLVAQNGADNSSLR